MEMANQFRRRTHNNHPVESAPESATTDNDIDVSGALGVPEGSPLHPLVDQILPLPSGPRHLSPSPMLTHEIERYEEEDDELDLDDEPKILHGGIDTSRYSEFVSAPENSNFDESIKQSNSNDTINYNDIYTTLSYASLQERNLELVLRNYLDLSVNQQQHLQELTQMREDFSDNLNQKRRLVDQVNVVRKKRQLVDFKPVNDYLNERWRDGIKSVVDLGIEAARMDMDIN